MSRTYRYNRDERQPTRSRKREDVFRCRRCKAMVGPVMYGGNQRNHCPYCLYSRHVDGRTPGDRTSACGALMEPIGAFTRLKGEHVVMHRCLACSFERYNHIAADDDFDLVLQLPDAVPAH